MTSGCMVSQHQSISKLYVLHLVHVHYQLTNINEYVLTDSISIRNVTAISSSGWSSSSCGQSVERNVLITSSSEESITTSTTPCWDRGSIRIVKLSSALSRNWHSISILSTTVSLCSCTPQTILSFSNLTQ